MPTFKEQQEKLTHYQHLLAIWEYVYSHLDSNYISKDGRGVERALRVPDCLVEVVPEDTVEDVLQYISEGPIKEYRKKIEDIENEKIGEDSEDEQQSK